MSAPTLDLNQGYAPETGGAEKPLPSPSQPALPPIPNNGIIATNAQDTSEGKRPEIPPNGAKGDSEATPTAAQPPPRPASRKQASAKGGKAAPAPKSGKDSKAGKGDNSKQEASGDQQASQIEELKATIQAREGDLKLLSERLEEEKLARNKAELEQGQLSDQLVACQATMEEIRANIALHESAARSVEESRARDLKDSNAHIKQILHDQDKITSDLIVKHIELQQATMESHLAERQKLLNEHLSLQQQIHEKDLKFTMDLVDSSAKAGQETTNAREKLEAEALALSNAFDQRVQQLREEREKQRLADATKAEEHRQMQTTETRKLHDRQIGELKKWFRDVTSSNSSTIASLKDENDRLKSSLESATASLKEAKAKLSEAHSELQRCRTEVETIKAQKSRR